MGGAFSDEITNDAWRPRPSFPSSSEIQEDGAVIVGRGSRVNVYKQDPTVKAIGHRPMWLLEKVSPGPSTPYMTIEGMPSIYGPTDGDNNYIYNPNINEEAFDAVHTLAIVSHVHWMYRRALKRVKSQRELRWNFPGPIRVYPHAGEKENAYYDRNLQALKFFMFDDYYGKRVKICRSWDVVAHETGHAILDGLQTEWIFGAQPEAGALHEAFGDITVIVSLLDQMDMCEAIISNCKGNLRDRANILATIGEEFGAGIGRKFGLRNATVDLTVSRATAEVHDLSRVFTGAVYDILVALFEESIDMQRQQPAEALFFAARHVLSLYLCAVLEGPKYNPRLRDIAEIMINKEPETRFKAVIRHEFTRREIFDDWAKPRPVAAAAANVRGGPAAEADNVIQCGTMAEMQKLSPQKEGDEAQDDDSPDGPAEKEAAGWFRLIPAAGFFLISLLVGGIAIYWRH